MKRSEMINAYREAFVSVAGQGSIDRERAAEGVTMSLIDQGAAAPELRKASRLITRDPAFLDGVNSGINEMGI